MEIQPIGYVLTLCYSFHTGSPSCACRRRPWRNSCSKCPEFVSFLSEKASPGWPAGWPPSLPPSIYLIDLLAAGAPARPLGLDGEAAAVRNSSNVMSVCLDTRRKEANGGSGGGGDRRTYALASRQPTRQLASQEFHFQLSNSLLASFLPSFGLSCVALPRRRTVGRTGRVQEEQPLRA